MGDISFTSETGSFLAKQLANLPKQNHHCPPKDSFGLPKGYVNNILNNLPPSFALSIFHVHAECNPVPSQISPPIPSILLDSMQCRQTPSTEPCNSINTPTVSSRRSGVRIVPATHAGERRQDVTVHGHPITYVQIVHRPKNRALTCTAFLSHRTGFRN